MKIDMSRTMRVGTEGRENPHFERAAKQIIDAMASPTARRLPDCDRLYEDFNRPLIAEARKMLSRYGVADLEAGVQAALEAFYRRFLFEGGLAEFHASAQQTVWSTAHKMMREVCFEMSQSHQLVGSHR